MRQRPTLAAGLLAMILLIAVAVDATATNRGSGGGTPPTNGNAPPARTPGLGANLEGVTAIGRGSDTTYNVSTLLGNLYTFSPTRRDGIRSENRRGDLVLNAPPQGSSVGIRQLADEADIADLPEEDLPTAFARSSRGPRPSDPRGLDFTAFARDAIVPVTFGAKGGPAFGVDDLTREQLKGIFVSCTIRNFRQIGGQNAPIEVYGIQEGSGTKATFDQLLGGNTNSCAKPDNIIFENSPNPILEAEKGVDPEDRGRAIFPFSFARLSTAVPNENINAVMVEGVEASTETITSRHFPLTRDVYFVTVRDNRRGDKKANRAADRFVNWVCKSNAGHTNDPVTGNNYGEVIDNTIAASGFGVIDCESRRT